MVRMKATLLLMLVLIFSPSIFSAQEETDEPNVEPTEAIVLVEETPEQTPEPDNEFVITEDQLGRVFDIVDSALESVDDNQNEVVQGLTTAFLIAFLIVMLITSIFTGVFAWIVTRIKESPAVGYLEVGYEEQSDIVKSAIDDANDTIPVLNAILSRIPGTENIIVSASSLKALLDEITDGIPADTKPDVE